MNLKEYDKLVTFREVGQHHSTEEAYEQCLITAAEWVEGRVLTKRNTHE